MSAISQFGPDEGPPNADARYRVLFESMSEGFLVCEAIRDASGKLTDYWIRDANPAFQANLTDTLVGKRIRQVRPDVSEEWLRTCDRVLTRGKPARFEYHDPVLLK